MIKGIWCSLLFLLLFTPLISMEQNESTKVGIKLDTNKNGVRSVVTEKFVNIDSYDRNVYPGLSASLACFIEKGVKTWCFYFGAQGFKEMYVKEGQKVIFKRSNGTFITLKTLYDIDQDYIMERKYDVYTNSIIISLNGQQLTQLMNGGITKIRIVGDTGVMYDYDISGNSFSLSLKDANKA